MDHQAYLESAVTAHADPPNWEHSESLVVEESRGDLSQRQNYRVEILRGTNLSNQKLFIVRAVGLDFHNVIDGDREHRARGRARDDAERMVSVIAGYMRDGKLMIRLADGREVPADKSWRTYSSGRRIEHRLRSDPFDFEGEILRIRGLSQNSGVIDSGRVGMRKWYLERKVGTRWAADSWVVLPNEAGLDEARQRFNFKEAS